MVTRPAVALMRVSLLSIAVLLAALVLNAYLLLSGAAAKLPSPGFRVTKEAQILWRAAWEILLLVANVVVLVGAVRMRRLKNYPLAKISAVIALIPCLGPCCLLGMPFGLWAMVVLNKPEVVEAFAMDTED